VAQFGYALMLANTGLSVQVSLAETPDVSWLTPQTGVIDVNGSTSVLLNFDFCTLGAPQSGLTTTLNITGTDENNNAISESIIINADYVQYYTPADFNHDGGIESLDLLFLLYAYGSFPTDVHWNPRTDIAGEDAGNPARFAPTPDRAINFDDLLLFAIVYDTFEQGASSISSRPVALRGASSASFISDEVIEYAQVGDEIRVPVNVDAHQLYGSEFNVHYDRSLLEYAGADQGSLLASDAPVAFKAIEKGDQLTIATTQLGRTNGANGVGSIAELIFRVRAEGSTQIDIEPLTVVDPLLNTIDTGRATTQLTVSSDEPTDFAVEAPSYFGISQNYPNPFNPKTAIQFQVPFTTNVDIAVYNSNGQLVKTLVSGVKEAGYHTVEWNGINNAGQPVDSGVYFYTIVAGDYTSTKRMVLLK
jgi:hypothetical protein